MAAGSNSSGFFPAVTKKCFFIPDNSIVTMLFFFFQGGYNEIEKGSSRILRKDPKQEG